MKDLLDYIVYVVLEVIIVLDMIYIRERMKKPRNKSEFILTIVTIIAGAFLAQKFIEYMSGEKYFFYDLLIKVISLYTDPK